MGQVEHKEKFLLLLHLGCAVHLLGSVRGGQGSWSGGRGGGFPLAVRRRRREAALPHESSSLPSLLCEKVIAAGQCGQATHVQKIHFL